MMVYIILIISIIIFCASIYREEKRRKSKSDSPTKRKNSDVSNDTNDNECNSLKRQLKEKEEIISQLRAELSDSRSKVESYLSLTKTSQEMILRNDERHRTVNKLWEEKSEQMDKQVLYLNEEVMQLRRQIEASGDELNSHQHKVNNLNRLLVKSQDRIEEVESQLEQLLEVEQMCQHKTVRIQQLEGDIEHLEEIRRKESSKLRTLIREKDLKIEQLENVCTELRMTTAVTSL